MPQTLSIRLNDQPRTLEGVAESSSMTSVLAALELQLDRVAVELNGKIIRRAAWPDTLVQSGDRIEVVHFVGGGLA